MAAYKTGFTRDISPLFNPTGQRFQVDGDTTDTVNLNIIPLPVTHGTITRTVKFADGTAAPNGTPVSFVSTDGTVTVNGTTSDSNGDYTVTADPNVYNGTATTTTPPATGTVSNITVPTDPNGAAGTATANFVLTINPSTISGTVTNGGVGVSATVSITPSGGTTGSATTLPTAADGTYTSPGLPAGTYTVTASATIAGSSYVGQAAAPVTLTTGVSQRRREHCPPGGVAGHADRHCDRFRQPRRRSPA